MNKYTTKSGQNLYDIALAIYGSIEGIFDLLISNPNISFETIFTKGTELAYHNDFILNNNIVNWLNDNKIIVKNGNYKITTKDIKEEIKTWIAKTNSQTFVISPIDIIGDITIIAPPNKWFDDFNEIELASETQNTTSGLVGLSSVQIPTNSLITPSKWGDTILTDTSVKSDWITSVKDKYNVDWGNVNKNDQSTYFQQWFSKGMILLPTDKYELETYYNNVSTPKIKIMQSGSSSAINMQIPANHFIAIDWGDDTSLDFYHYQSETIKATHTYEDSGEHSILIYGHNEYINLDFTGVNGTYYALSDIYIQKQFITPYPDATMLNKLFIIKQNE